MKFEKLLFFSRTQKPITIASIACNVQWSYDLATLMTVLTKGTTVRGDVQALMVEWAKMLDISNY
jgi:hypothetical protein